MFFWTKNSERRTLNFFLRQRTTDYSQQTLGMRFTVETSPLWRLKKKRRNISQIIF